MSDNFQEYKSEPSDIAKRNQAFHEAFGETEGWVHHNGSYVLSTNGNTMSASFAPETGCIEVAMSNDEGMSITGSGSDSSQAFADFARHVAHALNTPPEETAVHKM